MEDDITPINIAKFRLERARQDLKDAELCYQNNRFLVANNRAYYSIFHAIRAVLALEGIDFKRHKDVIAYFNQYFVKTEIFPKKLGKKITQAKTIREDSDYDDEFVADAEKTKIQMETAEELIKLVEEYIKKVEI